MNIQSPGATTSRFNPDVRKIFQEIKEVATNPIGCWTSIRGTYGSVSDFTINFLTPLLLVGAVVDLVVVGLNQHPGLGGITFPLSRFFLALAMAFLVAFILSRLASAFGGGNDFQNALKLYGYAQSPAMIAAAFGIIPALGAPLSLAVAVYCFYIFYQGISPMLAVPAERRVTFTIITVSLSIIGGFLLGIVARANL